MGIFIWLHKTMEVTIECCGPVALFHANTCPSDFAGKGQHDVIVIHLPVVPKLRKRKIEYHSVTKTTKLA